MSDERCPHCGSEDYASPGPHVPRICLACGYDDEHGTLGVCAGGRHPGERGDLCCDACWKRMPRDLPGYPRWRSRLRSARMVTTRGGFSPQAWDDAEGIHEAIKAWLADNPRETSNP